MNKGFRVAAIVGAIAMAGCFPTPDSANRPQSLDSPRFNHQITCYSGGQKIYEGVSVEDTVQFFTVPASSVRFVDKQTRQLVLIVGDCVIVRLSPTL